MEICENCKKREVGPDNDNLCEKCRKEFNYNDCYICGKDEPKGFEICEDCKNWGGIS